MPIGSNSLGLDLETQNNLGNQPAIGGGGLSEVAEVRRKDGSSVTDGDGSILRGRERDEQQGRNASLSPVVQRSRDLESEALLAQILREVATQAVAKPRELEELMELLVEGMKYATKFGRSVGELRTQLIARNAVGEVADELDRRFPEARRVFGQIVWDICRSGQTRLGELDKLMDFVRAAVGRNVGEPSHKKPRHSQSEAPSDIGGQSR